ncbi:sigma-70 family RNA polymerase sigma factor [Paenibacillus sp. SAFN-117]|uniref:sigma-70 family RNA polymerase sigma factor n=1 Tax=Paenibacillus sp. SAFN-117 TaxID=3436860 RepID=UPI003F7E7365
MSYEQDVILARDGDRDAFVRLIRHHEGSLYRVAKGMLDLEADSMDAIQEAIVKAYSSITKLREAKFFKTWLIRILINECNRILTYKKRVTPMDKIGEKVRSSEFSTPSFENVKEALQELEPDLKTTVILFYMEDLPLKQIAELLEIPEGTVKSRLYRGRNQLADLLKKVQKEEDL